jgi:hypothetical protein
MSNTYQDLADLFGVYEKSAQTPINTLNEMFSISGNPLFMYLTGVMSADDLRNTVQMATWEPVDISDAEYYVMERENADDPVLAEAYALIKQGVSINAAMRSMLNAYNKQAASNPQLANDPAARDLYLQYALDDITEFKKKWDNAQNIYNKREAGEYVDGPDGSLIKRMDPVKASDVLKQMGMPGVLQNPFVWEVVPDANLLAVAASHDERAQRALAPIAKMIDPATGMLLQREAQKMAKQATGKAQSAYEMMLNQTPEGRKYLKEVTTGKTQAEKSKEASGALLKGPLANLGGLWNGLRNIAGDIVDGARKRMTDEEVGLDFPERGTVAQIVAGRVLGNDKKEEKVNQDDYWAKLAASYAGRAEQERLQKPIDAARSRAMEASRTANEYRQGALNKGTTPAVSMLNQAFPFASALTQRNAPELRLPAALGASMAPVGGSTQDYMKWAMQDPRLKGMTPQQIDIFSSYFAKSLSGR